MQTAKKLVIIEAGSSTSKFSRAIINLKNINATIITNTLCDFNIIKDQDTEEQSSIFIQMELISLASTIVPDDLSLSPLASLFSKTKMIESIPLSPSQQFLADWFTKIQASADEKTINAVMQEQFKTFTNYVNIPIDVYPLSTLQRKPILIRYRDQHGPLRAYQLYGYIDFERKMIIEPEDMINAVKNGTDFVLENFDVDDPIIPPEVENIVNSADLIVISASDLTSLGILLSYKYIPETIKNSNGTIVVMMPMGSRFPVNPNEIPLLEALKIKPDIHGFINLINGISDIIVLDQADTDYIKIAQESGLVTVIQDLINVDDPKNFVYTILNEAGISPNDVIWMSELSPVPTTNIEGEQLPIQKKKRTTIFNLISVNKEQTGSSVKSEKIKQEEIKVQQPNISIPKKIESLPIPNNVLNQQQLSTGINQEKLVIKEMSKEIEVQVDKKDSKSTAEFITQVIAKIKEDNNVNLTEWSNNIANTIKNDLISINILGKEILGMILENNSSEYSLKLSKAYAILANININSFFKLLQEWLHNYFNDKKSVYNREFLKLSLQTMYENNPKLITQLLQNYTFQLIIDRSTPDIIPEVAQLIKTVTKDLKLLENNLVDYYLRLYDMKAIDKGTLWLFLQSFDPKVLGIALLEEVSIPKSKEIVNDSKSYVVLNPDYSKILEDTVNSWLKGDMDKVLTFTDELSNEAIKKIQRLALAQKIRKAGSVHIDTLSKTIKFGDPKDLEIIIREMISNKELTGSLKYVDNRVFITIDEEKTS